MVKLVFGILTKNVFYNIENKLGQANLQVGIVSFLFGHLVQWLEINFCSVGSLLKSLVSVALFPRQTISPGFGHQLKYALQLYAGGMGRGACDNLADSSYSGRTRTRQVLLW